MTATDLYIKKDGTISVGNGDSTVVGTGTTFGGIDRQGSLLIAYPSGSAPAVVGVVAALEDGEEYDDLALPLVDAYEGTGLTGVAYVLLPPPASFRGATQAAIYAYFTSFLRQNAGLFFLKSDITDWSIVPNNSLVVDDASLTLERWRNGVLEPVYAVGTNFAMLGPWDGGPGTALSISGGNTTVSLASSKHFALTVNANTEVQLPTDCADDDEFDIVFTGDGSHAVTFASGITISDSVRTGSGARTRIRFVVNAQAGGTATDVSGAMVAFAQNDAVEDGGSFYVSAADENTSEPGTDTKWVGLPITAGPQGKSAYEVAVDKGFEGSEAEWLESLRGGELFAVGFFAAGRPLADELLLRHEFITDVDFPEDFTGSKFSSTVAADSETVLSICKLVGGSPVEIGTATWSASGTEAALASDSAVSFETGDVLLIYAPSSRDAAIADISGTLKGARSDN